MAAINKIEKYGLQERVLALSGQGLTTREIADVITQDLQGQDTISQPTVSRWLKEIRKERSEQTREVYREYTKATAPKDCEVLDEVQGKFMKWFRDVKNLDIRTRAEMGMKALRVVELKARFAGLFDDEGKTDGGLHPVDLDEFRSEIREVKKAAGNA
ncbi:MAG: hypothetical protein JRI97_07695 [Deltaproteobacteria bacterium]|nr:hypothetical protein [Deltaproteobacteria bacterium]